MQEQPMNAGVAVSDGTESVQCLSRDEHRLAVRAELEAKEDFELEGLSRISKGWEI